MAIYSKFLALVSGFDRTIDLSTNTLSLGAMQLNGSSSGTFTQNANATTTPYSIFWPAAQAASSGYTISNDGSGNLTWVAMSSGANTALSNLAAVAINTSLLPGADNTINLGSASFSWANASIHSLLAATGTSVDVYGRALKDSASATQLSWSTSGVTITAIAANIPMAGFKLTGLGAGTTAGDSVRYEQAILTSGANAWTANQALGGNIITGSGTPINPGDLTPKTYVDNLVQGLNWKTTVRSATTTTLAGTYAYNNGTSGVGATITQNGTISGNSLNPQDGVTLVVGNRLLVKNETGGNQPYNGIYTVTQVGDGATVPYILTRATDSDTAAKLQWATVEVSPDASTQAGYIYRESDDITTIGTDNVAFALISHGLDWVFSDGLTVTGNTVKVLANPTNPSITVSSSGVAVLFNAAGAIISTATGIEVQLESSNPTLQISSNQLGVKLDGARAITTGASGIGVNVDNSSIEISSNALRIKTTAYDQSTITGGSGSAASVQNAPALSRSLIAGQTFTANTSYAVRWGLTANGETAGRIYAADITTSSFDLFYVIGMASSGTTVNAGGSITVVERGDFALSSADTAFASNTDGTPVFLTASGTFSTTAPSSSGQAVTRIGIVKVRSATVTSNIIDVYPVPVSVA